MMLFEYLEHGQRKLLKLLSIGEVRSGHVNCVTLFSEDEIFCGTVWKRTLNAGIRSSCFQEIHTIVNFLRFHRVSIKRLIRRVKIQGLRTNCLFIVSRIPCMQSVTRVVYTCLENDKEMRI